jgi:hypothetical protein
LLSHGLLCPSGTTRCTSAMLRWCSRSMAEIYLWHVHSTSAAARNRLQPPAATTARRNRLNKFYVCWLRSRQLNHPPQALAHASNRSHELYLGLLPLARGGPTAHGKHSGVRRCRRLRQRLHRQRLRRQHPSCSRDRRVWGATDPNLRPSASGVARSHRSCSGAVATTAR